MNGCLSLCVGPVIDWQPFRADPVFSSMTAEIGCSASELDKCRMQLVVSPQK